MNTDPPPAGVWPVTVHGLSGEHAQMSREEYWQHTYDRHVADGIDDATAKRASTAVIKYMEQLTPAIQEYERLSTSELLESLRADRFEPHTEREAFLRSCLHSLTIVAEDLLEGVADKDDKVGMVEVGLLERLQECLRRWQRIFYPPQ